MLKTELDTFIKENNEYGLKSYTTKSMGEGVKTTKKFIKEEIICTYVGEVITSKEAVAREVRYAAQKKGCYCYFFRWQDQVMCIDSTEDNKTLGRLINHSVTKDNVYTKVTTIDEKPYLYFVAKKNIRPHAQLLYNYNDAKCDLPWMKE